MGDSLANYSGSVLLLKNAIIIRHKTVQLDEK